MSKQVMTKDDGEATHDHNSSSSNNNDDDDDDDDGNNGNNNGSEENKGRETRIASTNDTDTTTKVACGLKRQCIFATHPCPALPPALTHPPLHSSPLSFPAADEVPGRERER